MQFNIGEQDDDQIRHDVAFSLKQSQSLLDITVLLRFKHPLVRLVRCRIDVCHDSASDPELQRVFELKQYMVYDVQTRPVFREQMVPIA